MIKRKGMNPALARASQLAREEKLINAAWKVNMIISLMVLGDKFDFTQEQTEKFMQEYDKQLSAYNSGHVESVNDYEMVLKEEYGIEIQGR